MIALDLIKRRRVFAICALIVVIIFTTACVVIVFPYWAWRTAYPARAFTVRLLIADHTNWMGWDSELLEAKLGQPDFWGVPAFPITLAHAGSDIYSSSQYTGYYVDVSDYAYPRINRYGNTDHLLKSLPVSGELGWAFWRDDDDYGKAEKIAWLRDNMEELGNELTGKPLIGISQEIDGSVFVHFWKYELPGADSLLVGFTPEERVTYMMIVPDSFDFGPASQDNLSETLGLDGAD